MKRLLPFFYYVALAAPLLISGCVNLAHVQRLSPAEQDMYRIHRQAMTWGQIQTYLATATVAERAAYLNQIGVTQRFEALTPEDRQTVLAGYPREGMSADAMRFLWGEPHDTEGHRGHYEHWFYLGSTLSLADSGNDSSHRGTMVEVFLVNNRVAWWQEFVPSGIEESEDNTRP